MAFTCTAIGVPAPVMTWSSETNDTINATDVTIDDTSTTSTLTLTNLMSFYFNQSYTCTASNDHGMINSSAFLTEGSELLYILSLFDCTCSKFAMIVYHKYSHNVLQLITAS